MNEINYEELIELDHSQLLFKFDDIRQIKELSLIITQFVRDEISAREFSDLLTKHNIPDNKITMVLSALNTSQDNS